MALVEVCRRSPTEVLLDPGLVVPTHDPSKPVVESCVTAVHNRDEWQPQVDDTSVHEGSPNNPPASIIVGQERPEATTAFAKTAAISPETPNEDARAVITLRPKNWSRKLHLASVFVRRKIPGLQPLTRVVDSPKIEISSGTSAVQKSPQPNITDGSSPTTSSDTIARLSSVLGTTPALSSSAVTPISIWSSVASIDNHAITLPIDSPIIYRWCLESDKTLYVGKLKDIRPPSPLENEWLQDVRVRLLGDLRPVLQQLPSSMSRGQTIVEPELCMASHAHSDTTEINLYPTILIRCGSKKCGKAIARAVDDLGYLHAFVQGRIYVRHKAPRFSSTPSTTLTDPTSNPDVIVDIPETVVYEGAAMDDTLESLYRCRLSHHLENRERQEQQRETLDLGDAVTELQKTAETGMAAMDEAEESMLTKGQVDVIHENSMSMSVASQGASSACGLKLRIRFNHDDSTEASISTIGGLIRVDDRVYGLTTGHGIVQLLEQSNDYDPSDSSSDTTCSGQALSSRPSTPDQGHEENSTDGANEGHEDLSRSRGSSHLSHSRQVPNFTTAPITRADSLSIPRDLDMSPSHNDQSASKHAEQYFCSPANVNYYSYAGQTKPARSGYENAVSGGSDFSLVELSASLQSLHNSYQLDPSSPNASVVVEIVSLSLDEGPVSILCSANDVRQGFLLESDALFIDRTAIFSTKKIQTEEPLELGLSGSWVVRGTNLLGIIVAIYTDEPYAHMLPINQIFADIRALLSNGDSIPNVSLPRYDDFETQMRTQDAESPAMGLSSPVSPNHIDEQYEPSEGFSDMEGPTREFHDCSENNKERIITTFLILLVVFSMGLENMMFPTLVSKLAAELSRIDDVGLYASTNQLFFSIGQQILQEVHLSFSSRWVTVTSLVIYQIGCVVSGNARHALTLIVGRAITGFGTSGTLIGLGILLRDIIPHQRYQPWSRLVEAVYHVAMIAGPVVAGALLDVNDSRWRWAFYLHPCLTVLPTIGLTIAQSRHSRMDPFERHDIRKRKEILFVNIITAWIGLVTLAGLLIALHNSPSHDRYSAITITVTGSIFVAALCLSAICLKIENVANRCSTITTTLIGALWETCFSIPILYLPIFIQSVYAKSALMTGFILVLPISLLAIFSHSTTWFKRPQILYKGFVITFSMMSLGCGLFPTLLQSNSIWTLVLYLAIFGVGAGIGAGQLGSLNMELLDLRMIKHNSTALQLGRSLGSALGTAFAQFLFIILYQRNTAKALPTAHDATEQGTESAMDQKKSNWAFVSPFIVSAAVGGFATLLILSLLFASYFYKNRMLRRRKVGSIHANYMSIFSGWLSRLVSRRSLSSESGSFDYSHVELFSSTDVMELGESNTWKDRSNVLGTVSSPR